MRARLELARAAVAPPSQPLRLPKSCSVFTCNDPTNPFGGEQTFYIVGTAHVSRASCEDVKAVSPSSEARGDPLLVAQRHGNIKHAIVSVANKTAHIFSTLLVLAGSNRWSSWSSAQSGEAC